MKFYKIHLLSFLLFLFGLSIQSFSQSYYQLKDILPGVNGSNIKGFEKMNGKVYFMALGEFFEKNLYETNGTEAGTFPVSDFSSTSINLYFDTPISISDSLLVFLGSTPDTGLGLYKSNGTIGSSNFIVDYIPDNWSSLTQSGKGDGNLAYFRRFSNQLYRTDGTVDGTFGIVHNATGFGRLMQYDGNTYMKVQKNGDTHLLKTDGSVDGTQIITKLYSGNNIYINVEIESINGSLYFLKEDTDESWGLWRTDGTIAGLTKIVDLNPPGFSDAQFLVSNDNKLFFIANDGVNGNEIYVSDGTASGTNIIVDLEPLDSTDPAGRFITPFKNGILFERNNELWFSDGTADSTYIVKEFPDLTIASPTFNISNSIIVDSIIYFTASTQSHGNELWKSDGTEDGTVMLADIFAGPFGGNPQDLTLLDDYRILFTAKSSLHGREPWIYEYKTPPPVGINSQIEKSKNELKIYPNPAFDENVFIEWSSKLEPIKMEIIDMTGRVVVDKKIDSIGNKMEINIQNLPSGIYSVFLRKTSGEIIGSSKLNIL